MSTRRIALLGTAGLGLILALVALVPSPALAQATSFFDPSTAVSSQYQGWAQQATKWAKYIYGTLVIFEIVALAITTLLFRDNISEIIGSVGLKFFIGGVYFWFINNAASGVQWPQAVISMFSNFGIALGGGGSGNAVAIMAKGIAAAGLFFEAGSIAKTFDRGEATLASSAPNCTFAMGYGYCNNTLPYLAATNHNLLEQISSGLALIIVLAIAAIFLQFILITIESYLVMGVGIVFIGFAGSRFTMQFSQGYFSYMINVGVKIMVLYIILGIESTYLNNILGSAGGVLLGEAIDVTGGGAAVAYTAAAVATFQVMIAAALVWTLPGFAASLLTGQSTVSGAAVMQQAMSSMAGASQAMAQLGSANKAESRGKESRSELAQMSGTPGASNGQPVNGAGADMLAPAQTGDTFAMAGASGGSGANGATGTNGSSGTGGAAGGIGVMTGSGGGGNSTSNFGKAAQGRGADLISTPSSTNAPRQLPSSGTTPDKSNVFDSPIETASQTSYQNLASSRQSGDSSGDDYNSVTRSSMNSNISQPPNQQNGIGMPGSDRSGQRPTNGSIGYGEMHDEAIRHITSRAEADRIASATDWKDLDPHTKTEIMSNQFARESMRERLESSEKDASRDEEFANAYMLGGLAQAAPREIGQPTAVQVRISNPDKL